ncbi:MAG: diaminopimelate epimerase [Flavobacteriales bacterium]|jgi:diaminopimelate epimerase|tara:strand:- start:36677 stop:37462 length:786 start_codon:yes stop_codon:yes gene_type:complete
MRIKFQKYQGTGNDFIIINNESLNFPQKNYELISRLCDRKFGIGSDGLILINPSETTDYEMVYFNSDNGLAGSMCGNGGRCSVLFALNNGIAKKKISFKAHDGDHFASFDNGLVSLSIKDVTKIKYFGKDLFIDTGSPHYIKIINNNLENYDVYNNGIKINNTLEFKNERVNVNFVEKISNSEFFVRTYERGVNNETLSCGTGVTAVALAMFALEKTSLNELNIKTRGGNLNVSFNSNEIGFNSIYLSGKVKLVYEGEIEL